MWCYQCKFGIERLCKPIFVSVFTVLLLLVGLIYMFTVRFRCCLLLLKISFLAGPPPPSALGEGAADLREAVRGPAPGRAGRRARFDRPRRWPCPLRARLALRPVLRRPPRQPVAAARVQAGL